MRASQPPRKACDLCYRKRIKCDGLKPRCSSCRLHDSECTHGAASRKSLSRKQASVRHHQLDEALQSRVDTLEGQVSNILERLDKFGSVASPGKDDLFSMPWAVSRTSGPTTESSGPRAGGMPTLQATLSIVQNYLATYNSLLPLFDSKTVLQIIRSWYQIRESRNAVNSALLNVVLALAQHTSAPGHFADGNNASMYLSNAQAFLTEVITHDIELINVQVILGLAILFGTADDLTPALTLVATGLRLAQKLGLHNSRGSEHLDPSLALQRSRVFWVAYILDRDISLRAGLAPIQLDTDIDLDLPPYGVENDRHLQFVPTSNSKWDFFRARVDLASIQGKVYDCVYSASARKYSREQKAESIASIFRLLDVWTSQIPCEFQEAALLQGDVAGLSQYLCVLYSIRLSCRTLVSFASYQDSFHYSRWLGHLQRYGDKVATGQLISYAPLPFGWQTLVAESREFLILFEKFGSKDPLFIQLTRCPHTLGLVFLIANKILDVGFQYPASDVQLIYAALSYLEGTVNETGSAMAKGVLDAVRKLSSYADLISLTSLESFEPASRGPRGNISPSFGLDSIT